MLGQSGVSVREYFRLKLRSALRPCNLTMSRSKIARNIAVKVSQAQTNQKKINQPGCWRGLSVAAKNVEPENKSRRATTRRRNMVLRRTFWSRMMPRVACTMNDTVRNSFCGGSSISGATLADAKEGRKNIRSSLESGWGRRIFGTLIFDRTFALDTLPVPTRKYFRFASVKTLASCRFFHTRTQNKCPK